jgi:hypothetical protein
MVKDDHFHGVMLMIMRMVVSQHIVILKIIIKLYIDMMV